ncbi:alpha/beta hydrolase [Agromyces sp. G08B096]|uniref:Alpha/beta hydrolase n=1 Tax=Agromyces sp. G08B096 TaxID=3156399 RepID=A0AAU7W6Q8_9MICO
MTTSNPTIVLVHGAFADSASWNGVLQRLQAVGLRTVAVANPLRSLEGDAAYLRDVVATLDGPVVLVGHSYGGMVISEAAAGLDAVAALVFVAAFAPDTGESALELTNRFPGGTLGDAVASYALAGGGSELAIRAEAFHAQFAADVPGEEAALMAATQRPVAEVALTSGLTAASPAWRRLPSWFVYGDADRNMPVALHRFFAERAGSRGTRELRGVSHALTVSAPEEVAATVLDAVAALRA